MKIFCHRRLRLTAFPTVGLYTAASIAATVIAGATPVSAHEHGNKKEMSAQPATSSPVTVENAWARATPGLAKNGGAYFTAVNTGKYTDRIVGVSSDMAARTELHMHLNDDGVMRMRRVDGVNLPAGGKVTFKPGGYHIMFIGLYKPLKKGTRFPVTLMFEKAGKRTIDVEVMSVGALRGGMKHRMDQGEKSRHNGK